MKPRYGEPVRVGQGTEVHARARRLDETMCRLGGRFGGALRSASGPVDCDGCMAAIRREAERAA